MVSLIFAGYVCASDYRSVADMARDYMNIESDKDKAAIAKYFDFEYFMPGMLSDDWSRYTDEEKQAVEGLFLDRLPRYGTVEGWNFVKTEQGMGEAVVVATNLKDPSIMYTFNFHKIDDSSLIYEITRSDSYSEKSLIEDVVKKSFIEDGVKVFSSKTLTDGKPVVLIRPAAKEKEIYNAAINTFPEESKGRNQFFSDLTLEAQRTIIKGLCERFNMSQNEIQDILTKIDYWYMDGGA